MNKAKKVLNNNKGMATLEGVILLIVFIVIASYSIGFFGVIHTGIKNSIAARNLAFETFRNRANVTYWRDNTTNLSHYKNAGSRSHGIISETAQGSTGSDSQFYATARQIAYVRNPDFKRSSLSEGLPQQLERQEANPVFIKTKYGICLNVNCGE